MNATEYLKNTPELFGVKKAKKFPNFKRVEFNGINDMYVKVDERTGQVIMFNITKLYKSLNTATKTASSCATTWVKTNIVEKGWFEAYPDKFEYVKGTGTGDFKGLYVAIDLLIEFVVSMAGLHGHEWFHGVDAWFEGLGKGWVYLIRVPQIQGTDIIKYGRTINLKNRWMIYLNKCPEELRALGVEILALAAVDNQSVAEDALAKIFDENGCLSAAEHGREFRHTNQELEDVWGFALDLFNDALRSIGVALEHIENFDEGTNIFRMKKDTQ